MHRVRRCGCGPRVPVQRRDIEQIPGRPDRVHTVVNVESLVTLQQVGVRQHDGCRFIDRFDPRACHDLRRYTEAGVAHAGEDRCCRQDHHNRASRDRLSISDHGFPPLVRRQFSFRSNRAHRCCSSGACGLAARSVLDDQATPDSSSRQPRPCSAVERQRCPGEDGSDVTAIFPDRTYPTAAIAVVLLFAARIGAGWRELLGGRDRSQLRRL